MGAREESQRVRVTKTRKASGQSGDAEIHRERECVCEREGEKEGV